MWNNSIQGGKSNVLMILQEERDLDLRHSYRSMELYGIHIWVKPMMWKNYCTYIVTKFSRQTRSWLTKGTSTNNTLLKIKSSIRTNPTKSMMRSCKDMHSQRVIYNTLVSLGCQRLTFFYNFIKAVKISNKASNAFLKIIICYLKHINLIQLAVFVYLAEVYSARYCRCYQIFSFRRARGTWFAARDHCVSLGGGLINIDDTYEDQYISSLLQREESKHLSKDNVCLIRE